MRFHLVSGSELASHVLYDPAVVEPLRADASHAERSAWRERQVATGRMLYYHASGDEELRLALLVDEPFAPPAPYKRFGEVDGAMLRVDSGRLCLCGVESVGVGTCEIEADVARADVWPGTYRVNAFRAEYRLPPERLRHEIEPQLEPGDAAYVRLATRAAPIGFALVLASVLAAFVFLFAHVTWWRPATAASAGVAVAAGAAVALIYASPRMWRWRRAKDALWKRYPRTVVVLRKIADDEVPATFPPGRFGAAATAAR